MIVAQRSSSSSDYHAERIVSFHHAQSMPVAATHLRRLAVNYVNNRALLSLLVALLAGLVAAAAG
jgi:hypothetical protein